MTIEDTYLGDGVYASECDSMIRLDLRGQDNSTYIYLEPETMDALIQFARKLWGDGVGHRKLFGPRRWVRIIPDESTEDSR